MEGIAATALIAAAARAVESEREGALFVDPLAASLAGPQGFNLFDSTMGTLNWPKDAPFPTALALRTRFIDDQLRQAVSAQGVRQVVLLAAGLDTRAFRIDWPDGVDLFEIDQSPILEYKEKSLRKISVGERCRRTVIEADLLSNWERSLVDQGFDVNQQAVWVAEGILFYFEVIALRGLLDRLAALSAKGSLLCADTMGTRFRDEEMFQLWRDAYASLGAPFRFYTDDAAELLTQHGWPAQSFSYEEIARGFGLMSTPVRERSIVVGRRERVL